MDSEQVFKTVKASITVSDREGNIIFMNDASKAVFGDKVGENMMPCHQPRSQEIIRRLMAEGATHAYTIQKKGQRKLIYQTPWYDDGEVAGLVEFSLVLPEDMPHYVRDTPTQDNNR
ncbi:MAG: PAS domain-containing protein [Bacteroidales bacterium]|nr:PAS domain-containing protein [Bacteroidales bacterium]